jgi:hypothetical protein
MTVPNGIISTPNFIQICSVALELNHACRQIDTQIWPAPYAFISRTSCKECIRTWWVEILQSVKSAIRGGLTVVQFLTKEGFFSSPPSSEQLWGPFSLHPGDIGVKATGHDADYSPTSSAWVENSSLQICELLDSRNTWLLSHNYTLYVTKNSIKYMAQQFEITCYFVLHFTNNMWIKTIWE